MRWLSRKRQPLRLGPEVWAATITIRMRHGLNPEVKFRADEEIAAACRRSFEDFLAGGDRHLHVEGATIDLYQVEAILTTSDRPKDS